jgi:fibronectin type 3 domain-containing protein
MSSPSRQIAARLFVAILLTLLAACGTPRPPLPPSLELPKPVADLRGFRKADKVTLIWTVPTTTTDKTTLRHLGPSLVCRSIEIAINRCDPVGTLQPSELPPPKPAQQTNPKNKNKPAIVPVQATYTDVLLPKLEQVDPRGFLTYAVETENTGLRSAGISNQIRIPLVPTLSVPPDLSASLTADGVVLTWSGVLPEVQSPGVTYTYRIYRRDRATKAVAVAGELPVSLAAQPKLVDSGMEWQKTYDYWITVVSVLTISRNSAFPVEGEDSAAIEVAAMDIFPPATPNGLLAVASGEGQPPFIDLTWAPNTEPDLAGYNVYRRPGTGDWAKINTEPVKSPTFRDTDVVRGNEYKYSVSAVDLRGNESSRSEETSETIR